MARIRLKVCCIASPEEARLAIDGGADALGLVAAMPSGPGVIADDAIADIARRVPPPVASVLLTSAWTAGAIAAQADLAGTGIVQIVRHIDPAEYPGTRRILRGRKLMQVVHVEGPESIALARDYARLADALLLDSGRPAADVAELGGTGRVHDWAVSRRIVEAVDVPVFLAGGLTPDNVAEAAAAVRPWAVDVCSGLRRDGRLDAALLSAFASALWS